MFPEDSEYTDFSNAFVFSTDFELKSKRFTPADTQRYNDAIIRD
jgi:hypothetical protein